MEDDTMKALRMSLVVVTACSLLIVGALVTASSASAAAEGGPEVRAVTQTLTHAHGARGATAAASDLSPLTLRELAQARRATAKYHDVANAIADGYVDINLYTSGEGYHYINLQLVDGIFNPEQPEGLLYANHPGEDGLKLVAVEYISPDTFPVPQGFTGDDDVWQVEEPFPVWVLNAWIWLHNPDGIFTFLNPRVP
jgi:hypothetical protein